MEGTRIDRDDFRLTAHSCGALVPSRFSGVVRAVFDKAVNIDVDGEDMIVALVTRRAGMSARSILVSGLPSAIARGCAVEGRDGVVKIGPAGYVELRTGGAPRFDGYVARLAGPGDTHDRDRRQEALYAHDRDRRLEALYAHVRPQLRDVLELAGSRDGLAGLLRADGGDMFSVHAARSLHAAELERLVGLGGGLTPSGDDFITGALAAEWSAGSSEPAVDRDALYRKVCEPESTTEVSRTQLILALRGRFPGFLLPVFQLAAEITSTLGLRSDPVHLPDGDPATHLLSNVRAAMEDAVSYGHSSGSDALTGILWRIGGLSGHRVPRL